MKLNAEIKEIVVTIEKAVNSSMNLRSKMELIRKFLSKINAQTKVDGDWKKYVELVNAR